METEEIQLQSTDVCVFLSITLLFTVFWDALVLLGSDNLRKGPRGSSVWG